MKRIAALVSACALSILSFPAPMFAASHGHPVHLLETPSACPDGFARVVNNHGLMIAANADDSSFAGFVVDGLKNLSANAKFSFLTSNCDDTFIFAKGTIGTSGSFTLIGHGCPEGFGPGFTVTPAGHGLVRITVDIPVVFSDVDLSTSAFTDIVLGFAGGSGVVGDFEYRSGHTAAHAVANPHFKSDPIVCTRGTSLTAASASPSDSVKVFSAK